MLYCVRFKLKPGSIDKFFPRHWKQVDTDVLAFFTKEVDYWMSNFQLNKNILEITLHNLATDEISVYSSTHAERIVLREAQSTKPEKSKWQKLLSSIKKPKS